MCFWHVFGRTTPSNADTCPTLAPELHRPPARQSTNELLFRVTLFIQIAQHRSVDWLTENPGFSRAYKIQFFRDILEPLEKDGKAFRVSMHMDPYGHSMEKAELLWTSCKWGSKLKWPLQRSAKHEAPTKTLGWIRKGRKVNGNPDGLRASGVYPHLFAAYLVTLWMKHGLQPDHPDRIHQQNVAWEFLAALEPKWTLRSAGESLAHLALTSADDSKMLFLSIVPECVAAKFEDTTPDEKDSEDCPDSEDCSDMDESGNVKQALAAIRPCDPDPWQRVVRQRVE